LERLFVSLSSTSFASTSFAASSSYRLALPQLFKYTVIGGTGQYQNLSANGTLQLVLKPTDRSFQTGTFTLKS
jgi:hypothetical protein